MSGFSTHAQRLQSHCKNGHEWTPENTWIAPSDGARRCRSCTKARKAAARAAARAAKPPRLPVTPEERRARNRAWAEANREHIRAYAAARRVANPDEHRANATAWRLANPEKVLDTRARRRAGIADGQRDEDTVAYMQLIAADPCTYCGGDAREYDHIVPIGSDGGHHWTNLTRACNDCNRRKRATPLLHWLLRYQEEAA